MEVQIELDETTPSNGHGNTLISTAKDVTTIYARQGVSDGDTDSCCHGSSIVAIVPSPPDGGYGWVVMMAGFMLSLILDGVCFSFGLYMEELLEYYNEGQSKTALIGSVLNGMYLTVGPIVSALCNKFGCRPVALIGSFMAGVSIAVSIFSPNISVLIITFGFAGGLGFGLLYLPAIVMVGFYFDKKRAFATGIAVCGSGIGGLIFAYLTGYLIHEYGWQGSVLITSGIVFNCLVMSSLLRPLEAVTQLTQSPPHSASGNISESKLANIAEEEVDKSLLKTFSPIKSKTEEKDHHNKRDWFRSLGNFQSRHHSQSIQMSSPRVSDVEDASLHRPVNDLGRSCDVIWLNQVNPHGSHQLGHTEVIDVSRPMFRKDAFFLSGSHLDVAKQRVHTNEFSSMRSVKAVSNYSAEADFSEKEEGCNKAKNQCIQIFDFSLLLSPTFLIYGTSCFLCMMGFFIPFTFVPLLAVSKGFTKADGALLISVTSVTNVVGRILVGWVTDRRWLSPVYINSFCLMIGGLCTAFFSHYSNMVLLILASIIFGICIAAFVSLRSIIMVELMGLERLSAAFGMVTLCQGLSSFIGAPIAGALSDSSGNYLNSFYLAGGTLFLSGLITLPLNVVSRWEKSRKK